MAFDNRHSSTHSWTAPNVWGTAPPKSPTQGTVSSFLGQEYTPSSPPSSRSRPRSLTLLMNTFSSGTSATSHAPPPPQTPLHQIDEEQPRRAYPTLHEVLHNTSQPPYTLSSFMAFLSMMHSLETLEFLLDASRYRSLYQQTFVTPNLSPLQSAHPDSDRIKTMWLRLIDAYVRPGGSREVNLPGELRDSLLRAPAQYTPPPPELLDASVNHIYNLMRDGVLAAFIANCDQNNLPPTSKSTDLSFTRNLWNKSPAGSKLLNRNNSSSSGNSSRSSSAELHSPATSVSSTPQPISIPYPMSSPHRSSFPPPSTRSMQSGFLSQSITTNLEDSHLDSYLENTSDEMSDIEEGSNGRNSSSGRASPMTPPLTPPPQGEGSPVREGGMWGRRVREKFRLRKS
jgi:hypothetical protein